MEVLGVVPYDECVYPSLCGCDTLEGLRRELWTVLHSAKDGLRIGVIVTHLRTTVGRGYTERIEGCFQGGPLHGPAVVRVHTQHVVSFDILGRMNSPKEVSGQQTFFAPVHRCPHNLSAPDIKDEIEIEKLPTNR